MAASGVCHSDLSVQNGTIPFMFPTVLGHEGAGVVAEVGDGGHPCGAGRPRGAHVDAGVPTLLLVPARARPCCARSAWPSRWRVPTPRSAGRQLVRGLGTATFGEETLVPEGEVVRVDPSVPLELAALVGCALATGVGAVWNTAGVDAGLDGGRGRVRRRGAVGDPGGPPGRGRPPSWPWTSVASKLELATVHGGHGRRRLVGRGPGGRRAGPHRRAGARTSPSRWWGGPTTIRTAFDGGPPGRDGGARRGGVARRSRCRSPPSSCSWTPRRCGMRVRVDRRRPRLPRRWWTWSARGAIDAEGMVTRRIGLDDVNDAFRAMEAGEVARSVIVYDGDATGDGRR